MVLPSHFDHAWAACNCTVGSAAGTIGTGFFLVLVFDVYRLIAMLAVISLLVAAVAASLSYQLRIRNDD